MMLAALLAATVVEVGGAHACATIEAALDRVALPKEAEGVREHPEWLSE